MCGIIGYVGSENSLTHLIDGLRALEYRGYDSAGVAYFDGGSIRCVKAAGRLAYTEALLQPGTVSHNGIGHTRWATHGAPSDVNSHPHGTPSLMLVHNGIIENYASIRAELEALGYDFVSDTDTEVAAKLLDYYYRQKSLDPTAAIAQATSRLVGSWALGILFADHPDKLYAARQGSPLIVGIAQCGHFIASDITAILRRTRSYYQLDDGEIAEITASSCKILQNGKPVAKPVLTADWDIEAAERGGFAHFMLKEINEEPSVIRQTLQNRHFDKSLLASVSRLHIVACGTAMHAGLIAKQMFGQLAKLPCEVEVASEFRYNDPLIGADDLVIIISQSGETADSLAALRLARQKGARTLAIVNVIGSTIAREAEQVLYTQAGPEIAVASTKAYSVQTALLTALAISAGVARGTLSDADAKELSDALQNRAPEAVAEVIAGAQQIRALAGCICGHENLFFIGRGIDYCLACEGSLKLKEISYIHSEAYAAGELKHGTISLIVEHTPVIALCTVPALFEKMVSNIRETKSRGADVIMLAPEGIDVPTDASDHIIRIPAIDPRLAFLPAVTALQLLAYYTALARGCDIDKPRNLAKSVTVE